MKYILYCLNTYAFAILEPIRVELQRREHTYIWYVHPKIESKFPYKESEYTTAVSDLKSYKADVIYCPGNEVPYFLRGLKTQVFHGLAGEKKGHFRIREYFDLYLTQGPYFTKRFKELKAFHKDFDVIETGWPKLDCYAHDKSKFLELRKEYVEKYNANQIILYAPTFSPKLTSAPYLSNQIEKLAQYAGSLILIKFHPLMDEDLVKVYQDLAQRHDNVLYISEPDITKYLIVADILVSDTSSVVYEFLLLDKPVITFNSISTNIQWENSSDFEALTALIDKNLGDDPYRSDRSAIIASYHPYTDGKSALRMVEAVEEYLQDHKVPTSRNISTFRKLKTHYKILFGK